MRKVILGSLAYCLAGLAMAHAQAPNGYQEPMPIRYSGGPYSGMPYMPPPVYAPNPGYGMPQMPQMPPQGNPYQGNPYYGPMPPRQFMPPQSNMFPMGTPVARQVPAPFVAPPPQQEEFVPPPPLPRTGTEKETSLTDDGAPAEPYLVGDESTWKPRKGYKIYGSAEFLRWFVKAQPIPSNITLSLSDPNNVPALSTQGLSGGRILLGTWITDKQDWGVEGSYFILATKTVTDTQVFPGSALSNIPIFAGINSESTSLVTSTSLWGVEANVRYECFKDHQDGKGCYFDLLGGFRYVDLSEAMTIGNTTSFGTAPVVLSDATVTTSDFFGTHNNIYAGQLGAEIGCNYGRFNAVVFTKLGMGENRQTVVINGSTQVSGPPVLGNTTTPGGFFTQPSNIGRYTHDAFSVLPEFGVNLGFTVSDHCRLSVGYNLLYLSSVVRPGDQIDPTAGGATRPSLGFLGGPGTATPLFTHFNESSFWAQGINLTVEFHF